MRRPLAIVILCATQLTVLADDIGTAEKICQRDHDDVQTAYQQAYFKAEFDAIWSNSPLPAYLPPKAYSDDLAETCAKLEIVAVQKANDDEKRREVEAREQRRRDVMFVQGVVNKVP